MCGIAGFSGSFDQSLLQKMNRLQSHRGLDDEGVWYDSENGIGLAHRRLSIQDLSSAGHQPMWNFTKQMIISFNGEIYNFRQLRAELVKNGHEFNSGTDTEVLLNLYHQYGTEMLSHLNGIFSFAIWDTVTQELFIARDGIGVKPFYYSETSNGFLFASEIKALLQESTVSRSIDPIAVAQHLTFLWCPAPRTMLSNIKKLEPGCALLVKQGEIIRRWRYYDLPQSDERILQKRNELTPTLAAKMVSESVSEAVERQMVADVPVGAFLSGGLDSSAVVSFARQYSRERLQCFTIDFNGTDFKKEGFIDDFPYAQRVAKHLDVDLHKVSVGPEMAYHLSDMIYHLDEPQADPAALNAMFICQLASKQGIKVLLSGAGGDDIFTGYRRHFALMQERYWGWLPSTMRQGMAGLTNCLPVGMSCTRRLRKAFEYAGSDSLDRLVSYFYWSRPDAVMDLLAPDIRNNIAQSTISAPLMSALECLPVNASKLDMMLYLEGKYFLADHNLNYTDKMAMAHGVEVRVPLLDPCLIAMAAALPDKYKQNGRNGKWIFKKAMEGILPNDIIYRKKTGFGAPLRSWLRNELKEMVDDILSPDSIRHRGLFNILSVERLRKLDAAGKVDASYPIFAIMCMELWCRLFLDRPTNV